jgi:hypothetical protein
MMVRHFRNEGFRNIKADIPEMQVPDLIYGTKKNHVPDLTAKRNGTFIILEAETSGSVDDDHTTSQWSLFADAANKAGGEFHVVVPKGSRSAAEQKSNLLSIQIDTIWTPN